MIQYFSGPLLVGPDMKENRRIEIGTVKVHYISRGLSFKIATGNILTLTPALINPGTVG